MNAKTFLDHLPQGVRLVAADTLTRASKVLIELARMIDPVKLAVVEALDDDGVNDSDDPCDVSAPRDLDLPVLKTYQLDSFPVLDDEIDFACIWVSKFFDKICEERDVLNRLALNIGKYLLSDDIGPNAGEAIKRIKDNPVFQESGYLIETVLVKRSAVSKMLEGVPLDDLATSFAYRLIPKHLASVPVSSL